MPLKVNNTKAGKQDEDFASSVAQIDGPLVIGNYEYVPEPPIVG